MDVLDILETAQYVVDSRGKRTGVLLDLPAWQTLQHLVEELVEDERLAELLAALEDEDKLTGEEALAAYNAYLTEDSEG